MLNKYSNPGNNRDIQRYRLTLWKVSFYDQSPSIPEPERFRNFLNVYLIIE
jgi:hypothetical protein